MAKLLPTGRTVADWKRLPSGLFVPGMKILPTGRELTAAQQLIQDVYIAAGRKNLELVTSPELGVIQATIAGRVSRYLDYSGRTRDWLQTTASAEPAYTASDPSLGGRGFLQAQGTRWLLNPWNPPAPGTQPAYVKTVFRFDSWPPGGRMGTGFTSNRYGWRTTGIPQTFQASNNLAVSPVADLPLNQWGILTWRLGNSVGDFARFGASANIGTGVNCGNLDPTSIAKFSINTGAQGISGSEGFEFRWSEDLTPTEDEDVEDLLDAYYSNSLLKYDSTGNIKPLLYSFFGDSQTRGDVSYGYEGFRFDFFTEYFTNLGYFVYATGTSSQGAWAQPANSGVSALGINIDSGGPNPGAALAFIELHYGSGALGPVDGAGSVQLMLVMIGGADIAGGTYVPVTTAADYVTLIQRILDLEPQSLVVVTTLCPQMGDPADIPLFNAELSDPGGAWDTLDAANPGREVIRYDAFAALGSAYNAALYLDAVHLNQAGQQLVGAALNAAVAAAMSAKTTY